MLCLVQNQYFAGSMFRRLYFRIISLLLLLAAVFHISLAYSSAMVAWYSVHVFQPFQIFRQQVTGFAGFSLGDVFYIAMSVSLIVGTLKFISYLFRFQTKKEKLVGLIGRTYSSIVWLYIVFLLGWGGNYYKPELSAHWLKPSIKLVPKAMLYDLDSLMVTRLNYYAAKEPTADYSNLNRRAKFLYRNYTNSVIAKNGLAVKASMLGENLNYFGIQGYYNPFTGEGQINNELPRFMKPFVMAHEMAHQTGIAHEGDANLMAYILSTRTKDVAFNYSAYFNMWLYTHSRLYRVDSNAAKRLKEQLSPLILSHIDTLKQIRKQYKSEVQHYSNDMYDQYLRMLDQEDGINSYYKVVYDVFYWENLPAQYRRMTIEIP